MILGKPVVVTRVGGISEVVRDHVCGMLVPSGDAKSFAEACLKVLQDKVLRDALSENAYKTIQENYSLDIMVNKTRDVYRKVRAV